MDIFQINSIVASCFTANPTGNYCFSVITYGYNFPTGTISNGKLQFPQQSNVVTIQNCYRSLMLDFSIVGGFVYQTLLLLLINSIYRNFYKGEAKNIL